MKISKTARREAKSLFEACRVNGVLDDVRVRTAVTAVIAQKPRGYVGILEHFHRLVKLDVQRRTARVENAIETSPALMQQLTSTLEKRYGKGLNVTFGVDRALIGGLRIQVGSDIFDSSVAARLQDLAASF
jgi:F-type H+-transporting ATPase subunit delta